ncbi:hypothetical protein SEA_ZUKO_86 [Streptomyces phage Zuko]|uniref:Uncharacterized protein n=1 Tax=Streptomyces phage Zuko TaxID=2601695 RepID=A0A5J6D774_9CAUD|nr:hypothetical protein PP630_gp086 [Streptomyces phage Zuko]QEQ93664.1 hypothetical protein SEA_ZUKO_86 [Streptomyces phage Zuko]
MKRTNTAAGYVVNFLGSYSAMTPEGLLIGRFDRKRDAIEAKPTTATEYRVILAQELGTDAITTATLNAMSETELVEWIEMLTA